MNPFLLFLAAISPVFFLLVFVLVRDTVDIYRSVIKYGGENPRILTPVGRTIQRALQLLTGRRRNT